MPTFALRRFSSKDAADKSESNAYLVLLISYDIATCQPFDLTFKPCSICHKVQFLMYLGADICVIHSFIHLFFEEYSLVTQYYTFE